MLERVRARHMPPPGKPRPSELKLRTLTGWIRGGVEAAHAHRRTTQGRVEARRLNRVEYENTLRDLLGVSVDFQDLLPEGSLAHGFDNLTEDQLKKVELEKLKTFAAFLGKLKETKEEGESLLDRTIVLFGSNLGNASSHSVKNLPALLAGGGFRHGQHLAFNPDEPPPLSNLYVSMLQRLGLEADRFGSSPGTLTSRK